MQSVHWLQLWIKTFLMLRQKKKKRGKWKVSIHQDLNSGHLITPSSFSQFYNWECQCCTHAVQSRILCMLYAFFKMYVWCIHTPTCMCASSIRRFFSSLRWPLLEMPWGNWPHSVDLELPMLSSTYSKMWMSTLLRKEHCRNNTMQIVFFACNACNK